MATEIKVPTLGESVTSATVARWISSRREQVAADEPLVELETDKVTVEVNAPVRRRVVRRSRAEKAPRWKSGGLLGMFDGAALRARPPNRAAVLPPPSRPHRLQRPQLNLPRTRRPASIRRRRRRPGRAPRRAGCRTRAAARRRQDDGGTARRRPSSRRRHRQGRPHHQGRRAGFPEPPAPAAPAACRQAAARAPTRARSG